MQGTISDMLANLPMVFFETRINMSWYPLDILPRINIPSAGQGSSCRKSILIPQPRNFYARKKNQSSVA